LNLFPSKLDFLQGSLTAGSKVGGPQKESKGCGRVANCAHVAATLEHFEGFFVR
jgi:hypothetical protein